MKCPICQHDNREGAKFCEECAALLKRDCVSCGSELRPTAKFCEECGTPTATSTPVAQRVSRSTSDYDSEHPAEAPKEPKVAPEGERRQLTVMFCDMVGFTELSSRIDPEVLQEIIRRYEDTCAVCITRYEGYVYQRLGDGIVAFFGFPLAHEGEAERAIHAGLSIISALADLDVPEAGRLTVRIGIASGLVVVTSAEKGAVGETMNLASRLQGIAQPGTVAISEPVRRLAGGTFAYTDLGLRTLKGNAVPTRAWQVAGVSQAGSRFEAATQAGLTPLVGREHEIAMLLERWRLAQDGEGQVVLLSGEPGIGKSRILDGLLEQLEAEGVTALRLQCSPYHINSAFYPTIDHLERALKFGRDELPATRLDKLESLLIKDYGLPLDDMRFVATLLSIPCEDRYGVLALTPQKHKDETIRTLVGIAEAAARTRSTVMLYEDVHWADPTSLEVLDQLIDRVRTVPLLVVLTHRPEFHARWSQHGHVTALNLSKLTRAQSSAMVTRLTCGKTLPAELLEQILAKTDGVPLFVEELTRAILESGELKDAGDHYEYLGTARTVAIPATLRDSLMARLDRYSPVKEVAQIGAAIGREFSYELVAAVAPKSKADLDSALEQLIDSGLAFRRGTPPEATYTFKHALVQDAAYDSLLKSARQTLHTTIARVLANAFPQTLETEPQVLAHHLTAAGQPAEAISYWQRAGDLAFKRLALKEAIAHLNQGMALIDGLPPSAAREVQELDLRTQLGTAWMALKGWGAPEVWTSLHPALDLAKRLGRHDALTPIYYGLCAVVLAQGRFANSLTWTVEMLKSAEVSGDADLLIEGHRLVCISHFCLGNLLESRSHGDRVMALYHEVHHHHLADLLNTDPKTAAGLYLATGAWMLGYPERAAQLSAANDVHARRRAHLINLGWALNWECLVWDLRAEPARILSLVEEAERLAHTHSLPLISMLAQMCKGVAWLRAGRIDESVAQLQAALDLWIANGFIAFTPYHRANLAEAMGLRGDTTRGLALIEESLAQIARPGWEERSHLAEILRLKGWMLSLRGDLDGAERNYQSSLTWAREQQAKSWELRTATSLARLWQSQGKERDAHALLAPIYDWFTEGFDTRDLKEARALLEEFPVDRIAEN